MRVAKQLSDELLILIKALPSDWLANVTSLKQIAYGNAVFSHGDLKSLSFPQLTTFHTFIRYC